jgi:hypothetical protein
LSGSHCVGADPAGYCDAAAEPRSAAQQVWTDGPAKKKLKVKGAQKGEATSIADKTVAITAQMNSGGKNAAGHGRLPVLPPQLLIGICCMLFTLSQTGVPMNCAIALPLEVTAVVALDEVVALAADDLAAQGSPQEEDAAAVEVDLGGDTAPVLHAMRRRSGAD